MDGLGKNPRLSLRLSCTVVVKEHHVKTLFRFYLEIISRLIEIISRSIEIIINRDNESIDRENKLIIRRSIEIILS
jgi:hypothetical protein